jgi:hypothetical protein
VEVKKAMKKLLNIIRVVNMYVVVFSLLFILQKYTLGNIPHLKAIIVFNKFHLYEVLFAINALIFIKLFVKIGIPKNIKPTTANQQ